MVDWKGRRFQWGSGVDLERDDRICSIDCCKWEWLILSSAKRLTGLFFWWTLRLLFLCIVIRRRGPKLLSAKDNSATISHS
jgi:hypothetical protein